MVWRLRVLRGVVKFGLFVALFVVTFSLSWSSSAFAHSFRVMLPLPDGSSLPAFAFLPQHGVSRPLPAVVVAVGVGGHLIPHYQEHCQLLANRDFAVVLIDPSNFPEELFPGHIRGIGDLDIYRGVLIRVLWPDGSFSV
jgi:hypothetical protein